MSNKVALLIIDPQYDFCDPAGKLSVKGADADSLRLANFINKNQHIIDDIQITLDSHYPIHIAHAICWVNAKGQHPEPLKTLITADDVRKGVWRATNPAKQQLQLDYVETLERNGRYVLVIWPEHCIIGSVGATIYQPIYDAVHSWEHLYAMAPRTTKGSNPYTEHYSAVQAEVIMPDDETTKLNTPLITEIDKYDIILLSGQARSHCVANTITDIANRFSPESIKKMVLLEDTTSDVPGFETMGRDFVDRLTQKGMQVATTSSFKF